MEKSEEVKTILGVTLLYTIISSVFSLLKGIAGLITEAQVNIQKAINLFLARNSLWIIVVAVIIAILSVYGKRLEQDFYSDILHNTFIRLMTGILVAIDGVVNLSTLLIVYIMNIKSSLKLLQQFVPGIDKRLVSGSIIMYVILILIILCQILCGIYLIKRSKDKKVNA